MGSPVIDAHVHVVSHDIARYPRRAAAFPTPWLDDRPRDVDQLLGELDQARVDGVVCVQPSGPYGFDNRYLVEAGRRLGHRAVTVATVDLTQAGAVATIERLVAAGVAGLRAFSIPTPPEPWLTQPDVLDALDAATAHGMVITVCLLASELHVLDRLLAARPEPHLVLDHCGFVDPNGLGPLLALAERPNLHLKLTSHVLAASDDPPATTRTLVDAFGPRRILWGSDYPQHGDDYAGLVELARQAVSGLDTESRDAVLGRNALRLWPRLRPGNHPE